MEETENKGQRGREVSIGTERQQRIEYIFTEVRCSRKL
jgi:hypothetical protein